jgi:hypothetical protein
MSFKLAVLGLVFLTGCGTSATITRRSGTAIDAEIISSDEENVYVRSASGTQPIPRREIADVDHPGNVAAVIGGVVAVYGAANIAVGAPQCDEGGPAYCVGVFTPAVIGGSIFIWGLATYDGSVKALENPEQKTRSGQVLVLPTHQFAGLPKTPGLSVVGTF